MSTDFQQVREALGARLRELRTEAGLNGKDFAARIGWQRSKVSRLENGRQTASVADVEAWAYAAGASDAVGELKGRVRGLETSYRNWRRQLAAGPPTTGLPPPRTEPPSSPKTARSPSPTPPAQAVRGLCPRSSHPHPPPITP